MLNTRTDPKPAPAKQTLDELVASRTATKLPAPPVFKREVVAVPEGGRGRKGSSELEAAVRANAAAAEEARRVAIAQRGALEDIAAQRHETEKLLAGLRREMAEERSEHERMVTQARFRGTQEERRRHEIADGSVSGPSAATSDAPPSQPSVNAPEMRRLHGQIVEREALGESHRQRLLDALRERDSARLELQRVSDARNHAERRLERVTEVLHRATSGTGPRPAGDDGVESQAVRALRDELAVAIARAKSAEARTNELRDEVHAVKNQRVSTNDTLEATREELDSAREELSTLHARLIEVESEYRNIGSVTERAEAAEARAREIEREVMDARSRAVDAEQRVAELTASLTSVGGRADLSLAVTNDLQTELAAVRRHAMTLEAEVLDVTDRARVVEDELAERATEWEAKLDAAAIEHGHHAVDLEATHAATAAELTSATARAEHLAQEIAASVARVAQLEAALAASTSELTAMAELAERRGGLDADVTRLTGELHERDRRLEALDGELTAAIAESVAAGGDCEALMHELDAARRAAVETEANLTDEIAATRRGAADAELAFAARLDAERAHAAELEAALTADLDAARTSVTETEAALTAAVDAGQQAALVGETESAELRNAAERAASAADEALATARAERDVAVAQADSLTLELAQRTADVERAEAYLTDRERELSGLDTHHGDALARLDDLSCELVALRHERDELLARADEIGTERGELEVRCDTVGAELVAVRTRADEMETTRSDDRKVAERAIEALRTKAEDAAARLRSVEDEMEAAQARRDDELARLSGELDAARARADRAEDESARVRAELADVARVTPARTVRRDASAPAAAPALRPAAAPRPKPTAPDRAEKIVADVAEKHEPPRAPSELRRAVFASLTELAGDG